MHRMVRDSIRLGMGTAAALMLIVGAGQGLADDVAGHVTAAAGDVQGADGPVAEGQHVKVGGEGGCSILVDQDAVVELCGQTSLVLKRDKDSNRRIVKLEAGEIRVVVEPRQFDERIEIHTPSAIALLLGTIVHVSIDPVTGATTISSAESKVAVRSSNPDVRGTTVVGESEQVTVQPGEAPPTERKKLNKEQVSELGGCLVDFHSAARGVASAHHGELVVDRLTAADADSFQAGSDGSRGSGERELRVPGGSLTGSEDVCEATDCGNESLPEPSSSQKFLESF